MTTYEQKAMNIMESSANGVDRQNATRIFHTNLLRKEIAKALQEAHKAGMLEAAKNADLSSVEFSAQCKDFHPVKATIYGVFAGDAIRKATQ